MIAPTFRRLPLSAGAAFAALLLGLAQPAGAADFQLENLKLDLGALVISLPSVAVKGSVLEREAFVSLFNGSTGESAAARMGRLDAAEISAPELTLEQTIGPQKQVTIYRDILFSDIKAGRIGHGEAARGTLSVTGAPNGTMSGELKRTAFDGLDLTHIARIVTEKAQPGVTEPMRPLFASFEQDGYALDMGSAGKMSLGKAVSRGFSARVGKEPLGETLARLAALSNKAAGDPDAKPPSFRTEEERQAGIALLSLYDTISYGSGEARDLAMSITAPTKPGVAPETVALKLARISFGEDTPAKSGFAIEGLQFAGGGGKGTVDSLSYSGFAFGPVIAELRALLEKPETQLDTIDYRRFIPTIGTIRQTGLSIEVPQPIKPGQPVAGPMKVGIGTFEIKAGEQLNGVPTSLSLTIDNLRAPVLADTGNATVRDLIAMGYKALDLSAKVDLAWESVRNELAIRAISLSGVGMGKFDASGSLGNVTKDLFSSDLALAQVAALGATVRGIEARLQNQGLVEKLIENEARKAKRKPEEVRQQYAMMASLGLAAILGPSDAAKALTAAVSRFVAKPGTLTVQASARSASGLGLADVITLTDPTEIFDKIDLKANAE